MKRFIVFLFIVVLAPHICLAQHDIKNIKGWRYTYYGPDDHDLILIKPTNSIGAIRIFYPYSIYKKGKAITPGDEYSQMVDCSGIGTYFFIFTNKDSAEAYQRSRTDSCIESTTPILLPKQLLKPFKFIVGNLFFVSINPCSCLDCDGTRMDYCDNIFNQIFQQWIPQETFDKLIKNIPIKRYNKKD